jgi:hypothetical protein
VTPKVVCQECRHENEAERIYCHNCGARLDRSSLATVKTPKDETKETQQRLKRMLDPRRAKARQTFFKVSKVILGAFALAAVIQMLLPPDGVPPKAKSSLLAPQINLDLETAATQHRPPELRYSDDQVNEYLTYALRSKQAALSSGLQFERAIVVFDEGVARMTMERSAFGFSVFTTTAYSAVFSNGNIIATNKGGAIGRLPIHPELMKYADFLFARLWTALDHDRKAIAKMGSIEFHPKLVVLTPRTQ